MKEDDEATVSRVFPLRTLLVVIGVGALVALCVFVSIPKGTPTSANTATPTATPSLTPTATKVEEDLPDPDTDVSSATKPSADEIWAFEIAYNTPDPDERLALLKQVATPQYISAEYSSASVNVDKLVVKVNRPTSSFSIDLDQGGTFCDVTTIANLQSFRDGKLVNSYAAPQHTTTWINTSDGWKVATEKR